MRDRRCVADRSHANSRLRDGTDGRLSSAARSFDPNFYFTHSRLGGLAGCLTGRLLSCERRSLSRTAKAASTRRRLSNEIALRVRDRDERVVEGSRNVNDPQRDVLSLFLLKSLLLCRCCFCHFLSFWFLVSSFLFGLLIRNPKLETRNYFLPGAFFFATAALRGPFLVRAFVDVRCPRTGRLLR
jgi:hypothetical protein